MKSAALYCQVLEQEGFQVEKGVCSIPTAFAASFGSGRPHIGILAEYDALSGLSQKAGNLTQEEIVPGGCGHGCGHNLLGAGALAAALGVKAYLETAGVSGTVTLYGCPGEEGGAAKAFMARDGLWRQLDAALTWHPEDTNEVITGSSNSCIQVQYTFHGIASHAAGAPDRGRSALDAVELMNIGVQFLREHMSDKARIHYAITDAGGRSPNVVQPRSTVLYMVRSNHVSEAVQLQKRVDKIADGAALMTETSYDRKFIDGLADTVPNHVLEALLHKNFEELGVPGHTAEELAFADALSKTYEGAGGVPGIGSKYDPAYAKAAKALQNGIGHAMNDPAPRTWATSAGSAPRPRSPWPPGPTAAPATAGRTSPATARISAGRPPSMPERSSPPRPSTCSQTRPFCRRPRRNSTKRPLRAIPAPSPPTRSLPSRTESVLFPFFRQKLHQLRSQPACQRPNQDAPQNIRGPVGIQVQP